MINNAFLNNEAKAWLKRHNGHDEIIRVVYDTECRATVTCYLLYTAFEETPDYLGRILFDKNGYWIYDGEDLWVSEQEQLARFITTRGL